MSVKIALAGNPNCGKTTLFNALTGSNQFVGNWPGVTVEKNECKLKGHKDVILTDLPGIYSLSPYTLEEVVARNYLIGELLDAIINIIDGTNLERNLYLSTQIIELGIPVVMAVNMMDVVRKSGDKIDIKALSNALGCEVVEISALKGEGIKEAADKAVAAAKAKKAVLKEADQFVSTAKSSPYGVSVVNFNWGSNMTVANAGVILGLAYQLTDDTSYLNVSASNLHYLLGSNPIGECFVTGFGTVSPQNPHHRPSMAKKQAMHGMVVGGVNSNLEDSAAKA